MNRTLRTHLLVAFASCALACGNDRGKADTFDTSALEGSSPIGTDTGADTGTDATTPSATDAAAGPSEGVSATCQSVCDYAAASGCAVTPTCVPECEQDMIDCPGAMERVLTCHAGSPMQCDPSEDQGIGQGACEEQHYDMGICGHDPF